ncbi:unnamed protein product [Caenorhabditis auriculariae]|uniref:Uncharacterized protein n=1 Tax=Caenorhabditis auriculariae TaxID=2777116 RepID=A0A8S1H3P4_9PELO|nr:unnamed protein product [Caenorhabditis auriculariae]
MKDSSNDVTAVKDEEETPRPTWTKRLSRRLNKRSSSLIASLVPSFRGPRGSRDDDVETDEDAAAKRQKNQARRASAAPGIMSASAVEHAEKRRRRSVDRIYALKTVKGFDVLVAT